MYFNHSCCCGGHPLPGNHDNQRCQGHEGKRERERGKEMTLIEFVFLRGCAGGHHRFQFDKESEDNFRSETFKIQKPRTAWTESDMDRRVRSQFSQFASTFHKTSCSRCERKLETRLDQFKTRDKILDAFCMQFKMYRPAFNINIAVIRHFVALVDIWVFDFIFCSLSTCDSLELVCTTILLGA